jgi:hypothetical protein
MVNGDADDDNDDGLFHYFLLSSVRTTNLIWYAIYSGKIPCLLALESLFVDFRLKNEMLANKHNVISPSG